MVDLLFVVMYRDSLNRGVTPKLCFGVHYSVRKLFTGFMTAALIAWKLIVTSAIKTASDIAVTKTHHPILTRYTKSNSHWCITHHATGRAMSAAINTSLMKSPDNMLTIPVTDAP